MVEDLIIAGKIWSISNKFFMLRNHLFPKVLALTSILVLSACGEIPPWPSTPTPSMVRELQQITTSTIAPVTTLAPGSRQEIVTGPIAIEPKNVKQVGKWAKLAKEQSYPLQFGYRMAGGWPSQPWLLATTLRCQVAGRTASHYSSEILHRFLVR